MLVFRLDDLPDITGGFSEDDVCVTGSPRQTYYCACRSTRLLGALAAPSESHDSLCRMLNLLCRPNFGNRGVSCFRGLSALLFISLTVCTLSCSDSESSSEPDVKDVSAESDSKSDEKITDNFSSKETLVITDTRSIEAGGLPREYRVYAPSTGPAESILVLLHGGGGAESPFPQEAEFQELADQESIIVALPKGYPFEDNEGEWQLNTQAGARHDIEFIEAMLTEITEEYVPATSQTYGIGYSLGSMFVYELACQLPDRFTALASFAGTMPVTPADCADTSPVSILHVHGTDDSIIPYADSWDWKNWPQVGPMRSIADLGSFWQEQFSCGTTATEARTGEEELIYSDCAQGVEVRVLSLLGQGHAWPETLAGTQTPEYMWRFLQ